jgi:putative tricarboxylic transport membrane protein
MRAEQAQVSNFQPTAKPSPWDVLARADVLSGLLFIAIAAFGLWASRNYPVGTALRMGTGYMPRLLCWLLLGLGVIVLLQGLRQHAEPLRTSAQGWRAVTSVTLSLVAFGLSIERLGLVLAILLLTGIGALATRALRPVETAVAALALIVLSWSIFIFGLGLTIPVWPEW